MINGPRIQKISPGFEISGPGSKKNHQGWRLGAQDLENLTRVRDLGPSVQKSHEGSRLWGQDLTDMVDEPKVSNSAAIVLLDMDRSLEP